jgi:cytochrome P450
MRRLIEYAWVRWGIGDRVLRLALRLTRDFWPIVRWRGSVYVLRRKDVCGVLSRHADFSVAIFGARMKATIGPFFLGMSKTPQYDREAGAMQSALGVPNTISGSVGDPAQMSRLASVQRYAVTLSRLSVDKALADRGEVDVVADLANCVPLTFARDFFGVPEPNPAQPSLLRLFQQVSYWIFAPQATEWQVPAVRAGRALVAHSLAVVQEGRPGPDDVLSRMLQSGTLNHPAIARSLLGAMSGTIIPTSWLFVKAIDRLLRLPKWQREQLHRFAREGNALGVRSYVIEAARFFPFPFFILRYCEQDAKIAGIRVAQGTHVVLVMGSAALDGRVVPRPERFVAGRPEKQYMLFGHDFHYCQGKDIAEALLTGMTSALFSRHRLRRAPGRRGFISYGPPGTIPEGSYPAHLMLQADLD